MSKLKANEMLRTTNFFNILPNCSWVVLCFFSFCSSWFMEKIISKPKNKSFDYSIILPFLKKLFFNHKSKWDLRNSKFLLIFYLITSISFLSLFFRSSWSSSLPTKEMEKINLQRLSTIVSSGICKSFL